MKDVLIKPATIDVIPALQKVVIESFLVPHGHAAPKKDIDTYVTTHFNVMSLQEDCENPKNEYYVLYYKSKMVGFSKLIFDYENENINPKNVAKLERIYLLQEVYGLGLGKFLFDFNIELAKKNNQIGIWLHVWVENKRALEFYIKMRMKAVGKYDFKVSDTHYNPNYVMYLEF